ncbi:PH domain-containing protein [Lapillicoccus jejuensis]|uniref:PH (Pleckstrin Homology) domain-containing protein n=1 Tax=Lapillicoccus jejuensis TaxID=402171 RepID=A0A542DY35_9MICO|nr:PH domain-containing protein [Lapillicoccus jejuensis]TQJ08011.1 PH (Pleckstrin Homology) domain-containing protein [Lapillicoccus jejuensis]
MARAPRYERYLVRGERVVLAIHLHWVKVAKDVGIGVGLLVLAVWVDIVTAPDLDVVRNVVWVVALAGVLRTAWILFEWRHDWFVATNKRLLLTTGFVGQRTPMMPMNRVTDMSYERSVVGLALGYGHFVLESAGQEQALRDINYIPHPDETYRAIVTEIFGADVPADEAGPDDVDEADDGYDGDDDGPRGPRARGRDDDPMAPRGPLTPGPGWVPQGSSPVVDYGAAGDHSRAIRIPRPRRPVRRGRDDAPGDEGEPLYLSEDLRTRRARTGPIAVGTGRDLDPEPDEADVAAGDDATSYGQGEDDELLWESFEEWGRDRRDG